MVEPPSVAAAIDGANADDDGEGEAVWYDSIEIADSEGVGAFAPVARGWVVRSSEPFGLGLGRMVNTDDSEEAVDSGTA